MARGFGVLVASASELLSFGHDGALQWRSARLGIDGVIVKSLKDGLIDGSGEWDPPGGWQSFRLCAVTGLRGSSGRDGGRS